MKLYQWFSICSRHQKYNENCKLCAVGRWVFMPKWWVGHLFYKVFPCVWRWHANRPRQREHWKTNFQDRRTGQKVNPFPNLK